jgi:prepilin-type processing-associated H-X9-DG protein
MRNGRNANWDNSTLNSDGSRNTRFMAVFFCASGLNRDAGCDFGSNMAIMPEWRWDNVVRPHRLVQPEKTFTIRPADLSKLYADNALLWDACELPPNYDRQYVCGYDMDYPNGQPTAYGSLADMQQFPEQRYRDVYQLFTGNPDLEDNLPINPGIDKDSGVAGTYGNIRWRHGKGNQANVLFADGTVRTLGKTTGYGTANVRGDFLRKFLRPKWPQGMVVGP